MSKLKCSDQKQFLFVSYEYIAGNFSLTIDYLKRTNEAKEDTIDMERLASARKRLHENYREAENGNLRNIKFHLPHHLKPIYGTDFLVLLFT